MSSGKPEHTPASAADNNVIDCKVEEVSPQNTAVWTWDASQHIGLNETNTVTGQPFQGPPWVLDTINTTPAADIYHCNSVAVDEDSSSPYFGDVLVSMRHLDAVFLIDKTTGDVIWKMGGTVLNSGDPESGQTTPAKYVAITGDSETQFCGQHDARFVPTPNSAVEDVSVYDDHTSCTGAARGVEYAIDTTADTATPDYQYAQQQGLPVSATGSFRRMPDAANDIGSGTSVIGWGISPPNFLSGFTEVDSSGNVLMDVRFPDGQVLYRAIKVAAGDVNLSLLRQTAGWTGSTIAAPPASPTVTSVVPTAGPSGGNTQVTITGSGLSSARGRVVRGENDHVSQRAVGLTDHRSGAVGRSRYRERPGHHGGRHVAGLEQRRLHLWGRHAATDDRGRGSNARRRWLLDGRSRRPGLQLR